MFSIISIAEADIHRKWCSVEAQKQRKISNRIISCILTCCRPFSTHTHIDGIQIAQEEKQESKRHVQKPSVCAMHEHGSTEAFMREQGIASVDPNMCGHTAGCLRNLVLFFIRRTNTLQCCIKRPSRNGVRCHRYRHNPSTKRSDAWIKMEMIQSYFNFRESTLLCVRERRACSKRNNSKYEIVNFDLAFTSAFCALHHRERSASNFVFGSLPLWFAFTAI